RPPGSALALVTSDTTPAAKRNTALRQLLRVPALQWCFLLDSDMVPPPDTLLRLLATEKGVVGALCAGRVRTVVPRPDGVHPYSCECGPPGGTLGYGAPAVFEQLVDVGWVGAAALLVRRPVVERLAD